MAVPLVARVVEVNILWLANGAAACTDPSGSLIHQGDPDQILPMWREMAATVGQMERDSSAYNRQKNINQCPGHKISETVDTDFPGASVDLEPGDYLLCLTA